MTPAKMLEQFGDDTKVDFNKGDFVNTPFGLGILKCQFSRGLRWHVETTKGTWSASVVKEMNNEPCLKCGSKVGVIKEQEDQYFGWCRKCAKLDFDSDNYKTE